MLSDSQYVHNKGLTVIMYMVHVHNMYTNTYDVIHYMKCYNMVVINFIPFYSTKIQEHYKRVERVLKLDNWTHRVHVHGIEAN